MSMNSNKYLPNYKDGSIVNLMSSVKSIFEGKSSYQPLKNFDVSGIVKKNVVFILIDGLGYEYLKKYGEGSFLLENLKSKITSVFPATTASALTTFATGVAPQQHALTGWFMYLKEIGAVVTTLPFTFRAGAFKLGKSKVKYKEIYSEKSFFEDLKATSFSIKHKDYIRSEYSFLTTKGAKNIPFSTINGFFRQIYKVLNSKEKRKFIFAYWDKFDSICHRKGTDDKETKEHFEQLDRKIARLAKFAKNKNTVIVVTADHGLTDTKEQSKIIELKDHPKFSETLSMPLSGEPRVVYCYVKSSKIKQFEDYVKTKFKNICEIHKSKNLIKENYFGLYEPNEKLKDRIGDYTLIMKENYIMRDLVLGEERNMSIGNHGGVSKEEMFVPLIVIE